MNPMSLLTLSAESLRQAELNRGDHPASRAEPGERRWALIAVALTAMALIFCLS
ncbi:MAG: hypothetical protein IV092_15205 [Burkholderiaceae bacterium]|nr:hypothetical protein [Burkholderiaceae bacterium]